MSDGELVPGGYFMVYQGGRKALAMWTGSDFYFMEESLEKPEKYRKVYFEGYMENVPGSFEGAMYHVPTKMIENEEFYEIK